MKTKSGVELDVLGTVPLDGQTYAIVRTQVGYLPNTDILYRYALVNASNFTPDGEFAEEVSEKADFPIATD